MDQDDLNCIYEFKTDAARRAAGVEAEASTAFVSAEIVKIHRKFFADPTKVNTELWDKARRDYNVDVELPRRSVYASTSNGYAHDYLFLQYVECKNADSAIKDPCLLVSYLISIEAFTGVILPDHPLNKKLDQATLSNEEYKTLLRDNRDVLEEGTLSLIKLAREGKSPPLGTRVVLFEDSVKVTEIFTDEKMIGIELTTTDKHTFCHGKSRHCFRQIEGSNDKLEFFNDGIGRSKVPLFGNLNNMIAPFMWMASSISGGLRYDLFREVDPSSDQQLLDFYRDKDGRFCKIIADRPEPGFKAAQVLVSSMGRSFGGINSILVAYFTQRDSIVRERAEILLQKAKSWDAYKSYPAKRFLSVDDDLVKRFDLMQAAKSGKLLTTLQRLVLDGQLGGSIPAELEGQRAPLLGTEPSRFCVLLAGVPMVVYGVLTDEQKRMLLAP